MTSGGRVLTFCGRTHRDEWCANFPLKTDERVVPF